MFKIFMENVPGGMGGEIGREREVERGREIVRSGAETQKFNQKKIKKHKPDILSNTQTRGHCLHIK